MDTIDVNHIHEVKKILGDEKLKILETLFKACKGMPPGVNAQRFRADHPQWINIIINAVSSGLLIDQYGKGEYYRLKAYALPLIYNDHIQSLLEVMERTFFFSQSHYKKSLSEPVQIQKILDILETDEALAREALYYMSDLHSWWSGKSNDFPYGEKSFVHISENVLLYNSTGEIISQVYEWHYVNPNQNVQIWKEADSLGKRVGGGFFTENDLQGLPIWFEELDDKKKNLIAEIDSSLKQKLSILPTIGIRTLIESVMLEKIEDKKSFKLNLKKFKDEGFVTSKDASLIDMVVDAGNAAAHRSYSPNGEDLRTCIEVVKHMLHGIYILRPRADKVMNNTPARQSKPKGD